MDETQAAAPETQPAAAAPLRLHLKHEWMRIKIGDGMYAFRTLSLADAIEVQPHLDRLLPAMMKGFGSDGFDIIYATEGMAILKIICPQILESVEDVKAINTPIINEVISFYKQQDWEKVKLVKALRNDPGVDGESDSSGISDQDTFFAIAGLCAERRRETVREFLDQRIEYCMEAILGLHAEYKRKSGEGKIPHNQFAMMMASMMGSTNYTQENAPQWIKTLSERADKEDSKN